MLLDKMREAVLVREWRRGLLPTCNSRAGRNSKMSTTLRLRRKWAARFYLALLAERDGEELLRAALLVE